MTRPAMGHPSLRKQQIELKEAEAESRFQNPAPAPSSRKPWAHFSTALGLTASCAKDFFLMHLPNS